jgi:hypothetical protein
MPSKAEESYERVVRKLFPVGCSASYSHGDNRIPCEIVHHGYGSRVQVVGPGGKPHWIDASRFC